MINLEKLLSEQVVHSRTRAMISNSEGKTSKHIKMLVTNTIKGELHKICVKEGYTKNLTTLFKLDDKDNDEKWLVNIDNAIKKIEAALENNRVSRENLLK